MPCSQLDNRLRFREGKRQGWSQLPKCNLARISLHAQPGPVISLQTKWPVQTQTSVGGSVATPRDVPTSPTPSWCWSSCPQVSPFCPVPSLSSLPPPALGAARKEDIAWALVGELWTGGGWLSRGALSTHPHLSLCPFAAEFHGPS